MSLEYAADHLRTAVRDLAASEQPLPERVQAVWNEHGQMVRMKPCLTRELLRDFRDLWHRYTAPSHDRHSTKFRRLDALQLGRAVEDLEALSTRVAVAAARKEPEDRLATLADL
jgi:hypothetical protein